MLFNSYQFLFVFFPTVFIVLMFMARYGEKAQIIVLLGASLLFYSLWDVRFLVLLGGSILTNYGLSRPLQWSVERGRSRHANLLLAAGVTFNLTVLGIFKYMQFIIYNMNTIAGTSFVLYTVILPLGISFFTFEQIGFLVDIRRGHLYRADLLRYALFVSFFPRLVAGPILRYGEILPQLSGKTRWRPAPDLAVGLTLFFMGLAKKSLLADGIAPCVAPVFAAAQAGQQIDLFMAWGGALAYTCQLYFDFSGYS